VLVTHDPVAGGVCEPADYFARWVDYCGNEINPNPGWRLSVKLR